MWRTVAGAAALLWPLAQAAADGWQWLPVTGADFVYEPTASLYSGAMRPESDFGDAATVYGLEMAFNSIFLQPPRHRIRTMVDFSSYEDGGLKLNIIEWNSHYAVEITRDLWLGAGPGLGFVSASAPDNSGGLLAVQLGAGIHYRWAGLYLGGDVRQQWTQDETVGPSDSGADNWRAVLKVGYNFGFGD